MDFKKYTDEIIAKEQGYVNHPNDKGGPTNWGITEAVARANGYMGHMSAMPRALAEQIYVKRYITGPGFDKVAEVSEDLAAELIDTGVNMGPTKAAMFLQDWLNGFNLQGSKYANMTVDGQIGPVTIENLKKFLAFRGRDNGIKVLLRGLNAAQAMRYLEITKGNEKQEDFLFGWMLNRVS